MLPSGGRGSERRAATCSPLPCTGLLSHTLCFKMSAGACMGGFLGSVTETCSAYRHDFCGPSAINRFFCDLPPVPLLSCSDTSPGRAVTPRGCGRGALSVLVALLSCGCTAAAVLSGQLRGGPRPSAPVRLIWLLGPSPPVLVSSCTRAEFQLLPGRDKVVSMFTALLIPM